MSEVRVVIDANVFIGAAFRPSGYSIAMLERIRRGEWRMVWHSKTRREIERVVDMIPDIPDTLAEGLFFEEAEYLGKLPEEDFGFIEDPSDRKFVALAVAADVPLITNNIHLLAHHEAVPVPIRTAAAFMRSQP